jgi:uncharacterized repeat protein (TIGR01451 family)
MQRIASSSKMAKLLGIAATLLVAVPAASRAETLSNTATITWDAGSGKAGKTSNRVDLQINRIKPNPGRPVLSTHQLVGSAGGGQSLTIPQTQCTGSNGPQQITLNGAFAGTSLSPAQVKPTNTIRAGEPLIVAVDSAGDNLDALVIETLNVRLETPSGDAETITLTESAANSARFLGIIRTSAIPPVAVRGDCILSVRPGDSLNLAGLRASDNSLIAAAPVDILIDPFGIVFDSGDGTPVAGSRVTLLNADTGLPAEVFGDDAVSRFPSSVVTGSTVTDAGGNRYVFPPGDYRFPFARAGRYRLLVEPPAPYTAPSRTSRSDLAGLRRPDGPPFTIVDGSYSLPFVLDDPAPVRIDIPVDRPGGALLITKTASQPVAVSGDAVQYRILVRNGDTSRSTGAITVNDILPREMRLRKDTVRYNGNIATHSVSSNGKALTVPIPALAAGASGLVTYLLEVRPDAKPGIAINRASASDNRGTTSPVSDASVRISRDGIGDRMTIIGRITDGGCTVDPDKAVGIGGVRVMLEDGSYTVTDVDGRYHLEGVLPGLHVVQMDPSTLPADQIPADCAQNARSAGSAISRFVEGRGGALLRVDFRGQAGQNSVRPDATAQSRVAPPSDQDAAGTNIDWFANQTPEVKWLFPAEDHNPRTKAVRVAIKHLGNQSATLFVDGKPVNALSFDGTKKNGNGAVAVSIWRAVELTGRDTMFTAEIRDSSGALVQTLTRPVHFSSSPIRFEFLKDKSTLVADGVTRPVIAMRLLDRDNRPVHNGLVGDFEVPAPYAAAVEADAQAARQLSGLERAKPVWHIEGDDGIAYIELEPTTASGGLSLTLPFRDGDVTRRQRLETWLTPGKRPWTLVGFAAGTAGFNTLESRTENLNEASKHWLTDARLALYAKGRIKGKWLMTLAYDSDKGKDESRFGGTIDPTAYYTIYADRSERRYDAASARKLYLRLERPQFYALFGDYETGINDTQLTRYQRAFNGMKAEFRNESVSATAFAADTPYRHRREEIQGNGLSGPYALSARDILANSERVVIEVRDRLRSAQILESRTLSRHIDYDIDYVAGTLRFREPVLSRASGLDPQFIIVDYEVDGVAQRVTNAGGRATWTNEAKTLTVGTTVIHNEDEQARTNVGGVDVRFTPTPNTEVRAEFAKSDANAKAGSANVAEGGSTAWLVEAEHHTSKIDLLAYAREQQAGYGVGQTNASENGTRKFGFDGRVRVSPTLSFTGSAWQENYLNSDAQRQAGRVLAEYKTRGLDMRAGLTVANDTLDDGTKAQSNIAQIGATKRLMNNRLELDAQTEIALSSSESIDFPARHKLGARFAVTDDISLIGSYELADGDTIKARTARVGFDLKPWTGGRFVASANQQSIDEYGPRSYAAYGFAQSLPVSNKITVDFTLDGNKTLGGVDTTRVLNPNQPVASGGFLGTDGSLTEDFIAMTTGATYRSERWSLAGRAEFRDGQTTNRYGLTAAALRQIGEGKAIGGSLSWFRAKQLGGPSTESAAIALSWANRPDNSRFSFLEKLELRSDKVKGAVFGQAGPIGGAPLSVSGNAVSRQIINSFSLNWAPTEKQDNGEYLTRSEISFFWGSRYTFDKIDQDDLKGWSNVFGADIRFDLGKMIDIGASGTLRQNPHSEALSYSGGPTIGITPAKNTYISLGYNVVGFHDNDFEDSRYTRSGPFVTLRLKFDQDSFGALGLGRK